MKYMKITPVLVIESIENSLPFWVQQLGFEKTVEVPEGDKLGFVILVRDSVEVMLQTVASVRKDVPSLAKDAPGHSSLFIEVDNFPAAVQRLGNYPLALPERVTFYGMREVGVFDPDGNVIILAAKA